MPKPTSPFFTPERTALRREKRHAWCVVFILLLQAGCSTFGSRGPVSDQIVNSRELGRLGIEATHQGRWEAAESHFKQAIEINPDDFQTRRHYANALWQRGAKREAVGQMSAAARLSGGDPDILVELGHFHYEQGDLQLAEMQTSRAITARSQCVNAWALRGDIFFARGHSDQALSCYHRALACEDDCPQIRLRLAKIYQHQGRYQRALATTDVLCQSCAVGSVPADALFQRGLALKSLGRYDAAVDSLQQAHHIDRNSVEIVAALGEALWSAGRPANARLAAQQALALAPQHRASRSLLSQIEAQRAAETETR
jgi:tetratricopeptide (TPR) repeat protein